MSSYTLRDDEIIKYCQRHDVQSSQLLSERSSSRKVIKLATDVVVKFGLGVTIQEASAQQLAFQEVNCEILRIPRVYHFFSRPDPASGLIGYLIMEHIEGVTLERQNWNEPEVLTRVVEGLNAIHSIRSKHPGPISGGEAHGSLWSEYGSGTAFRHVQDLESYLNDRLAYFQIATHMQDQDMCLCHMDVTPRNFMIDLHGRLCLLDWALAGVFPRHFELWGLDFAQHVIGNHFGSNILQRLNPSAAELEEIQKLWLVYRYNSHFAR